MTPLAAAAPPVLLSMLLTDALTRIRSYRGVDVEPAVLLHEVAGLGRRGRVIPDEVTLRRLRTM